LSRRPARIFDPIRLSRCRQLQKGSRLTTTGGTELAQGAPIEPDRLPGPARAAAWP
jgi:hypothetical protein